MNKPDVTQPIPSTFQSLDEQLRFAIEHKRLIRFTYAGRRRVAEPHDYGIQRGLTRLLVYQIHKAGSPRDDVGWRLLDAAEIANCLVLERSFRGTRVPSEQRHHTWDVLHARVA